MARNHGTAVEVYDPTRRKILWQGSLDEFVRAGNFSEPQLQRLSMLQDARVKGIYFQSDGEILILRRQGVKKNPDGEVAFVVAGIIDQGELVFVDGVSSYAEPVRAEISPLRSQNPPYQPPQSGNLPKHGKEILARVYESTRSRGFDQESAARQAWCQVKRHYYKRGDRWIRRSTPVPSDQYAPGCGPPKRQTNPRERRIANRLLKA